MNESVQKCFGEENEVETPSGKIDHKSETESETSITTSERRLLPFICSSLFNETPEPHEDVNANEGQARNIVSPPNSRIEFKN